MPICDILATHLNHTLRTHVGYALDAVRAYCTRSNYPGRGGLPEGHTLVATEIFPTSAQPCTRYGPPQGRLGFVLFPRVATSAAQSSSEGPPSESFSAANVWLAHESASTDAPRDRASSFGWAARSASSFFERLRDIRPRATDCACTTAASYCAAFSLPWAASALAATPPRAASCGGEGGSGSSSLTLGHTTPSSRTLGHDWLTAATSAPADGGLLPPSPADGPALSLSPSGGGSDELSCGTDDGFSSCAPCLRETERRRCWCD